MKTINKYDTGYDISFRVKNDIRKEKINKFINKTVDLLQEVALVMVAIYVILLLVNLM